MAENNLTQVPPVPYVPEDSEQPQRSPRIGLDRVLHSPRTIGILRKFQKYSSYVFSGFAFVHIFNMAALPALDLGVADEVLMMARDVYQSGMYEPIGVFGSALVHVFSGIAIRLIHRYRRKNLLSAKHKSSLKDEIELSRSVQFNSRTNDYDIKDDSVGTGGWLSVLGLGLRRSLLYQYLGLSPLEFLGYALFGALIYHVLKQRVSPILADGDSSLVSLSYVSHSIWTTHKVKSFVGLVSLVYVGTYHSVTGWLKWLRIYSQRKKTYWFMFINAVTLLAAFSVYRIMSLGVETGAIGKAFDEYNRVIPI